MLVSRKRNEDSAIRSIQLVRRHRVSPAKRSDFDGCLSVIEPRSHADVPFRLKSKWLGIPHERTRDTLIQKTVIADSGRCGRRPLTQRPNRSSSNDILSCVALDAHFDGLAAGKLE